MASLRKALSMESATVAQALALAVSLERQAREWRKAGWYTTARELDAKAQRLRKAASRAEQLAEYQEHPYRFAKCH